MTQNKCEGKIFQGSFCKQDPLRNPVFISLEIVCIPRTREQETAMHLTIPVDCIPNPVEQQKPVNFPQTTVLTSCSRCFNGHRLWILMCWLFNEFKYKAEKCLTSDKQKKTGEKYTAKSSERHCLWHHVWLQLRKLQILMKQNEQRVPGFQWV